LVLPPIPPQPSEADARAASKVFTNFLSEVAFVSELEKSVALAAVLSAVLRGAVSGGTCRRIEAMRRQTLTRMMLGTAARVTSGEPADRHPGRSFDIADQTIRQPSY
jgi:hypothetical protein